MDTALSLATEKPDAGQMTRQFLTYTVGDEEYGVDIMAVREVKGWTEVTRLPNTPDYMRGALNLRGAIIPIFDLRARLGGPLTAATDKHVVIILALARRTIGLLVDTVSDILTVDSVDIKDPPEDDRHHFVHGLIGVEQRMVVLLDVETLFNTP